MANIIGAGVSSVNPIAQYVLPGAIGFCGAVIGAAIGAAAVLLNGTRQRKQDLTVERERIVESRKGVRREVEARLVELGQHIASYRINGFGEMAALQATLDRLRLLMESEAGPASLPTDDVTRNVYVMLERARVNLSWLDQLAERDQRLSRDVAACDFRDWIEQCQIQYSNIINPTREALIAIFDDLGDAASAGFLRKAEEHYSRRFEVYSQRLETRGAVRPLKPSVAAKRLEPS